jgi:glycogen debranching enzyme
MEKQKPEILAQVGLPRLLPGEELIPVPEVPEVSAGRSDSSTWEILQLTGASRLDEIGESGPAIASLPLKEHAHNSEYRRYEVLFGRDSLRTADTLLDRFPKLARTTLLTLAKYQGTEWNDTREEEPGRILHELRDPAIDPIAQQLTEERGWGWPYYGSVDATPQFARTLAAYCQETNEGPDILRETFQGRDNQSHSMAESLQAEVAWMQRRIDASPDGFVEFKSVLPRGIENQVWRDSWDSFFHADGTLANHANGIVSTEVQRGVMDALYDAAELYETYLYRPKEAVALRASAEQLRNNIMEKLWCPDKGGYFVLGADRDETGKLRQLQIRTSDMGHLLHSRLLEGDAPKIVHRREAVIRQLFSPQMLCLNGIRTLADDEYRFRPGAYHNGSVWPWENYLISRGLEHHGYYGLARFLNELLLDDFRATGRSPEYLRGDSDEAHRLNTRTIMVFDNTYQRENVIEQPPQDIQAWSAAAKYAIRRKQANLPAHAADRRKYLFEIGLLKHIAFHHDKALDLIR